MRKSVSSTDLKRVLASFSKAGIAVSKAEIEGGKVTVYPNVPPAPVPVTPPQPHDLPRPFNPMAAA